MKIRSSVVWVYFLWATLISEVSSVHHVKGVVVVCARTIGYEKSIKMLSEINTLLLGAVHHGSHMFFIFYLCWNKYTHFSNRQAAFFLHSSFGLINFSLFFSFNRDKIWPSYWNFLGRWLSLKEEVLLNIVKQRKGTWLTGLITYYLWSHWSFLVFGQNFVLVLTTECTSEYAGGARRVEKGIVTVVIWALYGQCFCHFFKVVCSIFRYFCYV